MQNEGPISQNTIPVHCPVRGVYDITPCDASEIAPLLAFLQENREAEEAVAFPRGTVLPDGRLDLCKQNLGPTNCCEIMGALSDNRTIRSLLLGTDGIGDAGAAEVAALVSKNPRLEILYLGCNAISGAGVAPLCDAIADSGAVKGLWLKRNPIGDEGARHVARMLKNAPFLRTLDLVNTSIGPGGVKMVLEALLHENSAIERLYLGGNGIGSEQAAPIAELLRRSSTLRALLLNVNLLGDEGVQQVADGLRENATLETLGLASNGISADGATALAAALRNHPTLTDLDLGYSVSTPALNGVANTLGDSGGVALADFLTTNAPLRRLDLRRAGIGPVGRARLTAALNGNFRLTELRIEGKADAERERLLTRNRAAAEPASIQSSPDTALIRSVYRVASTP